MGKNGLDVSEFTAFCSEIEMKVMKRFPKETTNFMRREARKLTRAARKNASERFDEKTGNYLKGFKPGKKVYEYDGKDYNILVQNTAPHAHLLEEGHVMTKHGGKHFGYYGRGHAPLSDTKEFIPGAFVLRNTSIKFEPVFMRDVEEDLLDEVLKEYL